jgi:transcriptional regulator with XRE-family HTH domain
MEVKKLVGWNLRKLRVAKGLTIEDLAGAVGANASYVAEVERGEINIGIVLLDRLARVIGARITDLTVVPPPGEKPPKPVKAGRRPRRAQPARK